MVWDCMLERVKGIEPSYSAWEAAALPLSYTRIVVVFTPRAGCCHNAPVLVNTRTT